MVSPYSGWSSLRRCLMVMPLFNPSFNSTSPKVQIQPRPEDRHPIPLISSLSDVGPMLYPS